MTPVNDNDATAIRRKRLRFRSWHRGMKEMDLILGRFADSRLAGFDDAALGAFEAILAVQDQALYDMLVRDADRPAGIDGPVMDDLIAFARAMPRP